MNRVINVIQILRKERFLYMNTTTILTIIASIIGSGGISAIITGILSSKKYKSEARKLDQEAESLKVQNMDFIHKRLQEIADSQSQESIKLRNRNDELNEKIEELNDKLQTIMEWVVYDNQQYRQWLESRLMELDPDIEFPKCSPPPKIFHADSNNSYYHGDEDHQENDET